MYPNTPHLVLKATTGHDTDGLLTLNAPRKNASENVKC